MTHLYLGDLVRINRNISNHPDAIYFAVGGIHFGDQFAVGHASLKNKVSLTDVDTGVPVSISIPVECLDTEKEFRESLEGMIYIAEQLISVPATNKDVGRE